MYKNYLKIIVIGIFLTNCQEPFVPETESVPHALVVEGYLGTQDALQTVTLSYSFNFGGRQDYAAEKGATVFVTDEQGNRFDYYETSQTGIYRSRPEDNIKGEVGHTYTLHIITQDSVEYASTPQTIRACPIPLNLTCKPATQEVLTEDAYGDPLELYYNGINIDASSNGILNSGNFYQYVWNAYEEHFTVIPHPVGADYYYEHRRLSSNYLSVVRTGNADGIAGYALRNKILVFVSWQYLNDFTPYIFIRDSINKDSITYYSSFKGLLFKLEQRSLTPEAYEFWNGAEKQLNASGSLFDPIASQVNGNIYCVSDPGKTVYGIFTAYDVKDKYGYLYYNGKRSYSRPIDSFPKILLDTFYHNEVPPGWIDSPF